MRKHHRTWAPIPVLIVALLASVVAAPSRAADEYRIEAIADAAPADALSEEVAALIDSSGYKVVKGASRTVCELWLCKSWPVKGDFKATDAVAYPFSQGQLIGVLRLKNKGGDFRDQEIAKGVYTLRYAQQPVDGNHIGTSPTRDFLLLVAADADKSAKPIELQGLIEHSAAAAESKHPAMLALKKPKGDGAKPTLVHDEAAELWLATIAGKVEVGGKTAALPISIVVVGHANE
ncbi:MAG: hypothetical protein WD875_08875 [Pirellulales bacterium]